MALVLNQQGRALSHGSCPQVSVGGHASQGGFGFASRWKGLMVDAITAVDIVLANGTIINNLNSDVDSNLFWVSSKR
jgi:FAD/FMN-containing dehydrogenase